MSTEPAAGLSTEATVRQLLLLMPRLAGRVKRLEVPDSLQSLDLAPRHLSLLSYLLFDGPLNVSELAERLQVAPTTVSLLVSELTAKGVLTRHTDDADRRRHIIDISSGQRPPIQQWLAPGARAWQRAVEPLSPDQRATFIATLQAYEQAVSDDSSGHASGSVREP